MITGELKSQTDKIWETESLFLEMFGDVVKNSRKWDFVKFGDVTTSILGRMLDKKRETGKHLKPYLKNTNVKWFHFDFNNLSEMDFDEKSKKKYDLQFGDILICEGGEVGRAAIWKNERTDCYFQKALHRVRVNTEKLNQDYLVRTLYFYGKNGGFRKFSTSATIAHLPGKKLKMLPIPLPPLNLQNQFADRIQAIEAQKSQAQTALAKSEDLFNSLLQQAFNGGL